MLLRCLSTLRALAIEGQHPIAWNFHHGSKGHTHHNLLLWKHILSAIRFSSSASRNLSAVTFPGSLMLLLLLILFFAHPLKSTSCTTKQLLGITSCCLQNRFRSVLEMRAAMRDFARAARDYSRRYSAAIKMQSLARGFLARRAFAHLVAAHHHQLHLEQAKAAAALAVIAPWAATFVARCHILRLRSVCHSARVAQSAALVHVLYLRGLCRATEPCVLLLSYKCVYVFCLRALCRVTEPCILLLSCRCVCVFCLGGLCSGIEPCVLMLSCKCVLTEKPVPLCRIQCLLAFCNMCLQCCHNLRFCQSLHSAIRTSQKSTRKAGQHRDLMHRRATRLIQHSWRATWAMRNRAAVQIQAALRMQLAKQRLRKSCCAARIIQACGVTPGTWCWAESHIAH